MTDSATPELQRNLGMAVVALAASSGTLLCCVLPAVMVALGAGASLAGLVTAFPQLVWLSERKGLVFGAALAMLAVSAALQWRARTLPCPADPAMARACTRLRKWSWAVWAVATAATVLGALFAFALPALMD